MRRTVVLYLLPAAVVAANWLRLEHPVGSVGQALWVVLLALGPALVRPVLARVGVALVAVLLVVHTAFGLSVFDARPFDRRHDFFGPLLGRFRHGFLDFYDFQLPIAPAQRSFTRLFGHRCRVERAPESSHLAAMQYDLFGSFPVFGARQSRAVHQGRQH